MNVNGCGSRGSSRQVSEMDIPSGVKIDLSGKVAFVSGASKGIGVAIAGHSLTPGLLWL